MKRQPLLIALAVSVLISLFVVPGSLLFIAHHREVELEEQRQLNADLQRPRPAMSQQQRAAINAADAKQQAANQAQLQLFQAKLQIASVQATLDFDASHYKTAKAVDEAKQYRRRTANLKREDEIIEASTQPVQTILDRP